jgi:hypothetical protein
VIVGNCEPIAIVCDVSNSELKVIVSAPAELLACAMTSRRLPGPESLVLATEKTASNRRSSSGGLGGACDVLAIGRIGSCYVFMLGVRASSQGIPPQKEVVPLKKLPEDTRKLSPNDPENLEEDSESCNAGACMYTRPQVVP